MTTHFYADALGRIEAMHGIVKLDLVTFQPGTIDAEGGYEATPCCRLVLTPDGLRQLHAAMRDLVQQAGQGNGLTRGSLQ